MASLQLLVSVLRLHFFISLSVFATCIAFNYSDALDKSLMFFEAQRSGKLPSTRRVYWRGDSGLTDGFSQQVDLVGGYYDAGDHVKFGFPMAFSVTLLSWGALDYRNELTAANQMENTLDAIKWGTDYFIKAHSQTNVLWAQVGEGETDHCCWERAEDMTTPRDVYKIDSGQPGSDLAAETAAALAAASLAFQPFNFSYSALLITHAKQLFSMADNYRGQYDDFIPDAETLYPSSGYLDELLWAAAWLHRATKNEYYLQYAVNNAVEFGGTGNEVRIFSWDNKYAGLQILLSKVLLDGEGEAYDSTLKQYKAKADFFACAYMQKNNGYNVAFTPGGLAYLLPSNNLQYVASASLALAIYSDYLSRTSSVVECTNGQVQPDELLQFSKSQADYILGKNPNSMSYLIGFGDYYPQKAHHRGSSIPSITTFYDTISCVQGFEDWYKRPDPNPNVLYGALIGGPDSSDGFTDDRDCYEQNEPTTTAAAPLIGLFAKMQSAFSSGTTTTPGPEPDSPSPRTAPDSQPKPSKQDKKHPQALASPPQKSQVQHNSTLAPSQSANNTHSQKTSTSASAPAPTMTVDYVMSEPLTSAAKQSLFQYSHTLQVLLLLLLAFTII